MNMPVPTDETLNERHANDRDVVQFVKSVFQHKPLPNTFHEGYVQCNESRRQAQRFICYGYEQKRRTVGLVCSSGDDG